MEIDVDLSGDVVEDATEEIVVAADGLEIDVAAEDEEREGVEDAVEVTHDDEGGDIVEDPIEETVVMAEELVCENAAEEEED